MNSALEYVRHNRLETAIYAIVLIGTAFTFANARWGFSPKIAIPVGLAIFIIAGTLAYLQLREVATHPRT